MIKVKQKVLTLFTAMAITATMVSGCGQQSQDNQTSEVKESAENGNTQTGENALKGTIKFAFPLDKPKGQDEVTKPIEEKLKQDGLDLELEFTFIPFDQYWNKLSLIAASGEDYDITWTHITNISSYVSKKAMAPLNDALEKYGQELIKSTPKSAFDEVTIDGEIYAIPRVMPMAEYSSFLQIRGDLRKKYNIPEITTIEGVDQYFDTIAENEPDMTVYYSDQGRFLLREYGNMVFLGGEFLNAPVYVDPSDPTLKVKNTFESDVFKNIMGKMREWMAKGYIPQDGSSIPDPEGALNSGKLAATGSFVLKQTERIDNFKASMPEGELENVYLHPEKPKYKLSSDDNLLSIFSTSKHVNEAVAFINWTRTNQENYDLFNYGIKDVNYKLDGKGITYEGIAPEHSYMPVNWAYNDIRFIRFSKYISPEYEEELRNWDKDAVESPTLGFVPNLEPVKTEMAQLNAVIGEYKTALYNSNVEWDPTMEKFQGKLKDAGIDTVIKEIQSQLNEFIANKK